MEPIRIKVISGTTREGRFGDKPARWIADEAAKLPGVEVELLDLRDYKLPFFNEPVSPSMIKEPYANPVVQAWTRKIADGDAFIIVTAEYSHGYPAVLKNALDYVSREWNRKPVAFVSYGGVGGARSVEQLRTVVIELQMAPIRNAVHIQWPVYAAIAEADKVTPELFAPVEGMKNGMLEQLMWWANALKTARMAAAVPAKPMAAGAAR
ncbi:MAG TPA: NAD(P)H-dependent oxidoreductase [Candidatus Paceibacterota bacterium]|nr:NAD(P)H-dependent oxidoreductase [Candidatus Paceibacterota bacterium]